jgi:5-methylthioribose kinase
VAHIIRANFTVSHHNVLLLEASDRPLIEAYLLARHLVSPDELPCEIERAGPGNMNLTLRVVLRNRSFILKQGRPWVEKYDHIAAPWERTLIEGRFYEEARRDRVVASAMPRLLFLDEHNHVLALEDLGNEGDWSSMYAGTRMPAETIDDLLRWLKALATIELPPSVRAPFTNRAMRALNHEHIFALPLRGDSGLDLDSITIGLAEAARQLQVDRSYCSRVGELGAHYLSDGVSLVHGDFFPGSWMPTPDGVKVIDPEFCFVGAREFDYGVMVAHFALTLSDRAAAERVFVSADGEQLDPDLVLGFAGTEIMRRLIGVAQLPVTYGIDTKRDLLRLSRELVLCPERGLESW